MNENLNSLKIKKPLSWYNKRLDFNFKKIFISLSKATIMAISGNSYSATKEMISTIDAFKTKNDLGELGYFLIIKSLINASHEIVIENKNRIFKKNKLEKLYDDSNYLLFLQNIDNVLSEEHYYLSIETLRNPIKFQFINSYINYFNKWLTTIGIKQHEANIISERFKPYFLYEIHNEWRENFEEYSKLISYLDSPMSTQIENSIAWERYQIYLKKQINEPIFHESFSLSDIYVPLRGYYELEKEKINEGKYLNKGKNTNDLNLYSYKIPFWVEEELNEWLNTTNYKETIKIISGGPGSGKSTFTKIWSYKVSLLQRFRILFIPLHQFNIQNDLFDSIEKYVTLNPSIGFKENPLEQQLEERLVLVFDGLDELTQQGVVGEESAQLFIRELERISNLLNSKDKIKLLILLSGRELIIQNHSNNFRMKKQILNLLPYNIKSEKFNTFFSYSNEELEEFNETLKNLRSEKKKLKKRYKSNINYTIKQDISKIDHKIFQIKNIAKQHKYHQLLSIDQRDDWWEKFGKLKNLSVQSTPQEFRITKITEITSQPLLNYLVSFSYLRGKIHFGENTNLNEIYNDLIEGVYERDYEGGREHNTIKGLKISNFKRILEEMAFTAWKHGDIRTTSVKAIENHLSNSGIVNSFKIFKDDAKTGIKKLLMAFYFRQYGNIQGDPTFEFTHKSFGEYLASCKIISFLNSIYKNLDARINDIDLGFDKFEALQRIYHISKYGKIDKYLFDFMVSELELIEKSLIEKWYVSLLELLNIIINKGFPINEKDSWSSEIQSKVRNSHEFVLVLVHICSYTLNRKVVIKRNNIELFGKWFSSLKPNKFLGESLLILSCFVNWQLDKVNLSFHNLSHVNFSKSTLEGAKFNGAILNNSDFSGANLRNSDFENANLEGANLSGANLENANLKGANLKNANLNNCNLKNSTLTSVTFVNVKVNNANFSNANFSNSYIPKVRFDSAICVRVNFSNSILIEANFTGVNLREAIFKQANLLNTKFSAANLENSNFDNANCRKADFFRAKLKRANLSFANFKDANFEKAILTESKLFSASFDKANLEGALGINKNFVNK